MIYILIWFVHIIPLGGLVFPIGVEDWWCVRVQRWGTRMLTLSLLYYRNRNWVPGPCWLLLTVCQCLKLEIVTRLKPEGLTWSVHVCWVVHRLHHPQNHGCIWWLPPWVDLFRKPLFPFSCSLTDSGVCHAAQEPPCFLSRTLSHFHQSFYKLSPLSSPSFSLRGWLVSKQKLFRCVCRAWFLDLPTFSTMPGAEHVCWVVELTKQQP